MNQTPMILISTDEVHDPDALQLLFNTAMAKLVLDGGGTLAIGAAIYATAKLGGGMRGRFHPDGGFEVEYIPLRAIDLAPVLNPDHRQWLLNVAFATLVIAAGGSMIVPAMRLGEAETTALVVSPAGGGIVITAVDTPIPAGTA